MTNHFHLLATQSDGNLQKVMQHLKSYTAKQIIKVIEENPTESRKDWLLHMFRFHARYNKSYDQYHFWQQDNHPTECFSPEVAFQKLEYIHLNTVRAGYVEEPHYWRYSSANPNSPIKVLSL